MRHLRTSEREDNVLAGGDARHWLADSRFNWYIGSPVCRAWSCVVVRGRAWSCVVVRGRACVVDIECWRGLVGCQEHLMYLVRPLPRHPIFPEPTPNTSPFSGNVKAGESE